MKLSAKHNKDTAVIKGHGLGFTKWKGCCSLSFKFTFFKKDT